MSLVIHWVLIGYFYSQLIYGFQPTVPVKINVTLFFLAFFCSSKGVAQLANGLILNGIVVVDGVPTVNVAILNLENGITAFTGEQGEFSMEVKPGTVVHFSGQNIQSFRKRICSDDFEFSKIHIKLESESILLQEVAVTRDSKFTAEKLGIIPFGQKKYSVAERRLKTAGDFKTIHLLGLLGGSLPLDPIINKISGKTRRLKNELQIEKKQFLIQKLKAQFPDEFYLDKLNIHQEQLNEFQYFCIENSNFSKLLQVNNRNENELMLVQLAANYNQKVAYEK